MTIYVSLIRAGGAGPKIDAERWDVPVEMPDRSEKSYELALDEGRKRYAERFNCHPDATHHFGTYS